MRNHVWLAAFFFAFALVIACGSETVPLVSASIDGGGGSTAVFSGCSETGATCTDGSKCCSNNCQNGDCAAAPGCGSNGATCTSKSDCCSNACGSDGKCVGSACEANGATCTTTSDCCSGRCASGFCVEAGSCEAPTTACDPKNDTCCSGMCEPVQGQAGVTQCDDFCSADGASCTKALDCCNLDCNSGKCGGAECTVEGEDCTQSAECCSNICGSDNKCALDSANTTCRPTGETCNSGPQKGCCSGLCDDSVNPPRCLQGAGTCKK